MLLKHELQYALAFGMLKKSRWTKRGGIIVNKLILENWR